MSLPMVQLSALKETTLLNMGIFAAFVLVTLVIVIRASRNNKTAADYYAAGSRITGPQNGLAIAGDFMSATTFLGMTGMFFDTGVDPTGIY
ncbi:MAG: cation acetate symporter, partial [Arthrobacter sp.]|nr:cation acetate symporter [Arthrobacter sp.]